jgi:hypothetical protein
MDRTPWHTGNIPRKQGWFTMWKSVNMIPNINRMKCRNCIIITIYTKEALDRIQHIFMTILNEVHIEKIYLSIVKAKYDRPQKTFCPLMKSWNILSKDRNKKKCSLVPVLLSIVNRSPRWDSEVWTRKRI